MGQSTWGLEGAEAVLKLQTLQANGDFTAYWRLHVSRERRRIHALRYQDRVAPPRRTPEAPREATQEAAARASPKLTTRLSKGEKRNRKRIIDRIEGEAARRQVQVPILVDFVHVLEYLWKAALELLRGGRVVHCRPAERVHPHAGHPIPRRLS